jgi:hypothetical protein
MDGPNNPTRHERIASHVGAFFMGDRESGDSGQVENRFRRALSSLPDLTWDEWPAAVGLYRLYAEKVRFRPEADLFRQVSRVA